MIPLELMIWALLQESFSENPLVRDLFWAAYVSDFDLWSEFISQFARPADSEMQKKANVRNQEEQENKRDCDTQMICTVQEVPIL